jgi:ABC-2 type transport system ATP-binding protein
MSPILEINDVIKKYGSYAAVNRVSFSVPRGALFGLLGPNGAGKTSLIRMITTITRADSGTILLNGELLNDNHPAEIGYMPEERGLYKKMKVGEQLLYLGQLRGMSETAAKRELKYWFEKFEIQQWYGKKVEELSKGMQQKVQFISTVLHKPDLLILDEPFSGLDPINANLIKDEIYELNKQGTSIIFSTHRMEQVEEICDSIVLINRGENVLHGKVKDIKNQFKENLYNIQLEGEIPTTLEHYANIIAINKNNLTVQLKNDCTTNDLIIYILARHNVQLHAFNEILPTLNEIFIKKVGESDE